MIEIKYSIVNNPPVMIDSIIIIHGIFYFIKAYRNQNERTMRYLLMTSQLSFAKYIKHYKKLYMCSKFC